jgi:multidrug efflux system outer membrane protein
MSRRIPVLLASLLLALTGCFKIGPDYRKPEAAAPESWRFEPAEVRDTANTRWWEQFGDPVLVRLIGEAVRRNYDLRIAAAAVEEYLGLYRITRADLFPQISGNAIGQQQELSGSAYGSAKLVYDNIQAALNLSWEIDLWGRLRRATEASRADLLGREENRRTVLLTLVTAVARSYVQLRELDLRLDIARRTLSDRREALRIAEVRFRGELSSEAEVRQAESEVYNASAQVPFLEKLVAQKEHELSVLLGRNPAAVERGLPLTELNLPPVPAGLPSDLLSRRPDIRQAEQGLIAANARIGAAVGEYFPKFTITGTVGNASADFTHFFAGPAGMWSWGAALAMPVFTAGRISGQVEAAEARARQALFLYRSTLLTAFQETEDSLVDHGKTREQVAAIVQQVEVLRQYLKLARLRYENGYTPYLEVLDAQRNLFSAEIALASARSNALQALINIYKAFGGGWVEQAG